MKKYEMVSPLDDYVFSEIFGNQRHIENTRAFLKTLLDIPEDDYSELTIRNPFLRKIFKQGKTAVVDLRLTTKSGKIIHIELQVEKRTNLKNRITYYASRLIGDQLNWGDDYDKLHQVISIIICDHILLKDEKSYINKYELKNGENRLFSNLLKIIILELPKLPETEDRAVWHWLKFLKAKKKEEFEMLAKKYPDLEKPIFYPKNMSLLEIWRDIRFHKNLQKVDERMLLQQWKEDGLEEGKAKGLIEGKAEARLEIAIKMKNDKLPLSKIKKFTGLSAKEIEKL